MPQLQPELTFRAVAYIQSCKSSVDCIPGPNMRRLLVGLHMEGEPFRLAASRHHLVHRSHYK
jgi:hypothetical protein